MKKSISCLLLLFASFAEAETSLSLSLEDGVELDATYYPANRPGPGLLFLNMCNPTVDQSEWTEVARTMSSKGYHVLTFDVSFLLLPLFSEILLLLSWLLPC